MDALLPVANVLGRLLSIFSFAYLMPIAAAIYYNDGTTADFIAAMVISLLGGLTARAMGFVQPAKIGPIWLKHMSSGKPLEMKPDFDRLLGHDFAHLIAGHGSLLRDDARGALRRSCARIFGS